MMKRKVRMKIIAVIMLLTLMLSACSLTPICKASDCDSKVYQDGYCKYHYYLKNGEDTLKEIINGF